MGTLETALSLLNSIPVAQLAKEKADLLKSHIELMGEQVKWAEKKLADAEKENSLLKTEVESLREMVAASALSDEFEQRGPVVYRKGDVNPRCPECRAVVSQRGNSFTCPKCSWKFEDITIRAGTLPGWRR